MKLFKKYFPSIFFIISLVLLFKVFFLGYYQDFGVYYYGLKGINYPPVAVMFFSFLPLIPYFWAGEIWTAFSIISLFVSVYLIFKIYKRKFFSNIGLIVLGLVCLSFPVKFTLGMGQVNNFVLLIFVAAIYFLNKNRRLISMFLFALSFAIKLFPVYLIAYFLFSKKWKELLIFAVFLIILSLTALFILGWQTNAGFYLNSLPSLLTGWKLDYYNQSLTGFIGRSITSSSLREIIRTFLTLFFIITTFFVVFKTRFKTKLANLTLSLLITLNLIINNFSWQHHFVFLIFPFITTLFFILDNKLSYKYLVTLFIAYLLVSLNLKYPNDFPVLLRSHVFYGSVLLWVSELNIILKNYLRLQPDSVRDKRH